MMLTNMLKRITFGTHNLAFGQKVPVVIQVGFLWHMFRAENGHRAACQALSEGKEPGIWVNKEVVCSRKHLSR